jgi:hypothetical protein
VHPGLLLLFDGLATYRLTRGRLGRKRPGGALTLPPGHDDHHPRRLVAVTDGTAKRCSQCGEVKPRTQFTKRMQSPDGRNTACRTCNAAYRAANQERLRSAHAVWVEEHREYLRAYRQATKEQSRVWRNANRERLREQANQRARKLRDEVLSAYGGACACCGETERAFLQIDHVNNDGAEHRRATNGVKLDYWIRRHGFPPQFQILCCNCNFGRHLNGGVCPHVQRLGEVVAVVA